MLRLLIFCNFCFKISWACLKMGNVSYFSFVIIKIIPSWVYLTAKGMLKGSLDLYLAVSEWYDLMLGALVFHFYMRYSNNICLSLSLDSSYLRNFHCCAQRINTLQSELPKNMIQWNDYFWSALFLHIFVEDLVR